MSYADTRLDLAAVDVACLSGSNGAGKSALLDAVTWALWEQARSSSDELIRLSQGEMWVDLVFHLDGQSYRVRRARARTTCKGGGRAASKGTLDFQVWSGGLKNGSSGGDEHWTSLNGPSMKETQARITSILKMDYETFINSAYLKQGRADEFTLKPPSERKAVLSEILGLGYFDKLQEEAREEARRLKAEMTVLSLPGAGEADVETQLAESSAREQAVQEQLQLVSGEKEEAGKRLQSVLRELEHAQVAEANLSGERDRLATATGALAQAQERQMILQARLAELEPVLARASTIEAQISELGKAKEKLERLDTIASRAQELKSVRMELKAREASARGRLEVELDHCRAELADLQKSRQKLQKDMNGADKVEESYRRFRELLAAESELANRQENFSRLSLRADELKALVAQARVHLQAEIEQKQKALVELTDLVANRDALLAQGQDLEAQSSRLERLETQFELVEERGLKVKSEIEALEFKTGELRLRLQNERDKIKEIESSLQASSCPLCAAPIVDRQAVIDRYRESSRQVESEISELAGRKGLLAEERTRLRQEYLDLRNQLEERKSLDVAIGQYNEKMQALLRAETSRCQLENELAVLTARLDRADYAFVERESLVAVKSELARLDFDPITYASMQSQIRFGRASEVRYQELARNRDQLVKLEERQPVLAERIAAAERKLAGQCLCDEDWRELERVDHELTALAYNQNEHALLRRELSGLMPALESQAELKQARQDQPELTRELAYLEQKIADATQEIEQCQARISQYQKRLDARDRLTLEEIELENKLACWQEKTSALQRDLACAQMQTHDLHMRRQAADERRTKLGALSSEFEDFSFLAEAFGKKGIQAVIIENVVPEIEAEANRILSRLSDNRMHVALITQQKTLKGTAQETLEIVIADDIGTRNYELYSGGEAFKVNFAIRIALSRLLARRAGAKLQTLIIDEGFGSQDETSRARLIKAINSIRTDFSRILVVTHISEIKDLFPVQIVVNKQEGVSSIEVVA